MFKVANKTVGKGYKPFIIAEMSANHGGYSACKQTILAARDAGADAVKMQTYTGTMTIDSNREGFLITDGLWKGYNLFQLYKERLPHLSGMRLYLNSLGYRKLYCFQHLLMKRRLT